MTGQDATDISCIVRAEVPVRPQEKDFSQGRQSNTGAGSAVYIPGDEL